MTIHAGVGIGVLVKNEGKILMIHRQNSHGHGTWSCPGGHIDFGESFEECASRECLEETGIRIKNIRFKTITNDIFKEDQKHYVTIWMEADFAEGNPCVMSARELTEVGWFDLKNLPKPLFLPMVNLINHRNIGQVRKEYDNEISGFDTNNI
jgi:8-oxo-dGTP diphosphatase